MYAVLVANVLSFMNLDRNNAIRVARQVGGDVVLDVPHRNELARGRGTYAVVSKPNALGRTVMHANLDHANAVRVALNSDGIVAKEL